MNIQWTTLALAAALLLPVTGSAWAADGKVPAPQVAASRAAPGAKAAMAAKPASGAAQNPTAKRKLVDINRAGKAELMTLPGIGEAQAQKIIAGRPYGSKAHLASHHVLERETYLGLSDRIVAKQPYKDAARNVAAMNKKL